MELNVSIAFLAGIASVLNPCVIPLIPIYISFISGVHFSDLTKAESYSKYRLEVLLNSLIYTLGFSLIFVLMGLGASAVSVALISNRMQLLRVGGFLIVLFGLFNLGVFNKFLLVQKEYKLGISMKVLKIRYLGPFLMGVTFALAWTPCIGPILGGILTLAATSKTIFEGAFLLFVYSLGISLPFLLIALTIGHSYKLLTRLRPRLHYLNIFISLLLITIGLLLITQKYNLLVATLQGIWDLVRIGI